MEHKRLQDASSSRTKYATIQCFDYNDHASHIADRLCRIASLEWLFRVLMTSVRMFHAMR